ncbi:uncharacterized protein G2W53_033830 [Senna tora]|uniref:Uncharacterized protein n=1 Tax=Senna tora TaxID=362788 RepID=A0A834WD79_9FABA|nr:uncharacterized protein G2W53_033830 [Senna tora]
MSISGELFSLMLVVILPKILPSKMSLQRGSRDGDNKDKATVTVNKNENYGDGSVNDGKLSQNVKKDHQQIHSETEAALDDESPRTTNYGDQCLDGDGGNTLEQYEEVHDGEEENPEEQEGSEQLEATKGGNENEDEEGEDLA